MRSWIKRRLAAMRAGWQKIFSCQIPCRHLKTVKFPHPVGIVIGDGARIGRGVRIYQNVTIGLTENQAGANEADYPTIGDEVVVYAGAVIIGGITIGERSIIGANAVIRTDIPPDSVAFGYNQWRPRERQVTPTGRSGLPQ